MTIVKRWWRHLHDDFCQSSLQEWTNMKQKPQWIFKGYCTSSRINCGMAKSLAQARACEGLLAGDLALIPQLILELVQ